MAQPSIQAECMKRVPAENRGTASSTYYMCSDIGQGLGAMLGGKVADSFGYGAMYNCVALIFLIVAASCGVAALKGRRKAD